MTNGAQKDPVAYARERLRGNPAAMPDYRRRKWEPDFEVLIELWLAVMAAITVGGAMWLILTNT